MEPKNSEYYLGNCDCPPTILQIKTGNTVITQELPWDASMEDMVHAFYTACVGITFLPETILEGMRDYAESNLPYVKSENEEE